MMSPLCLTYSCSPCFVLVFFISSLCHFAVLVLLYLTLLAVHRSAHIDTVLVVRSISISSLSFVYLAVRMHTYIPAFLPPLLYRDHENSIIHIDRPCFVGWILKDIIIGWFPPLRDISESVLRADLWIYACLSLALSGSKT